ncbi:MAG: hypothetical protein AAB305_00175 [Candidatus Zixiibacteriota bacterium]
MVGRWVNVSGTFGYLNDGDYDWDVAVCVPLHRWQLEVLSAETCEHAIRIDDFHIATVSLRVSGIISTTCAGH